MLPVTVGNIFGTPVVEQLTELQSHFCECLQYPEIVPLRETLFWKQPQVIHSQVKGSEWVFHSNNRFLGQELLDRERLVRCSIVMVENPVDGPKCGLQYFHIISLDDCFALWNEFKVNSKYPSYRRK
jgi:hypothetical protein